MGRPSKLTDKQRSEIQKRLLANEKPADLAREFKVSPATISRLFSKQTDEIKDVANQLVSAEDALRRLGVSQQLAALNLADDLRGTSMNLAGAARLGSATALRLAGIANAKVQEISDSAPLTESVEALKGVAVLTKLSNDAAGIGLNLLAANKDAVKRLNEDPPPDASIARDMSTEEAQRIYQDFAG